MARTVIQNGWVFDGAGNPWTKADVEIIGERISHVGKTRSERKAKTVNAKGLAVTPGFIDIHCHSDLNVLANPRAESVIHQGLTTQVFPNCGTGPAPLAGSALELIKDDLKDLHLRADWSTLSGYMNRIERKKTAINVALLIPHGTLRACVMGFENRGPTRQELDEMKSLTEQCMKEGAFGMCTGLRYVPGSYADPEEVEELLKVVGKYGGFYASHVRDEGDRGTYPTAIAEAIQIGEKAGVPVQISHFKALGKRAWGKIDAALKLVDEARARGVDVMADQYPYAASGTGFMAWIPRWSHEGGINAFMNRLRDPDQRRKIVDETREVLEDRGGPENALLTRYAPNPSLEGKTLAEISKEKGDDPVNVMLELLIESEGETKVVNFNQREEDVVTVIQRPEVMICTDGYALAPYGVLRKGQPHPRSYGSFPRVLARYVREQKVLNMEEAVRKMTSLPAQRLGLQDRGLLKPGMFADIVVFDPERIADKATFVDPHKYPEGIEYVFVNGIAVIEKGKHTGKLPGKVLRKTEPERKARRR